MVKAGKWGPEDEAWAWITDCDPALIEGFRAVPNFS